MSYFREPKLMITPEDVETIREKVAQLIEVYNSKTDSQIVTKKLAAVKSECDRGLQYRVVVGRTGVYSILLNTLSNYHLFKDVTKMCFKTLTSLMRKQPDLLDDKGVGVILLHVRKDTDPDLKKFALKWTKECCVMHEKNRQKIFNANIVEHLKDLLPESTSDVLKEGLAVCRALVLDDDVRVEFGKAHEHARVLAIETLCTLTNLLNRFQQDDHMVADIMMTITCLLVREEFCKKAEDAGSLEMIREAMVRFVSNEKIIRQCFRLVKAISGNDHCKIHIIEKSFAPVITATLDTNKAVPMVVISGLHCVAAITLRCPQNSKALIDSGLAKVIVDIMKIHPDEENVQKTASWAIRNMVSRNKTHGKVFIKLGVEELLQNNLKKFVDIEYDVKAALRDLNCNVNLKEEWTGKGGALTTGFTFTNIEYS